jgi:hypothetical protein
MRKQNKNDLKWQKGNETLSFNRKMNKTCFLLFIHSEIYFFLSEKGGEEWEKGEDYPLSFPPL